MLSGLLPILLVQSLACEKTGRQALLGEWQAVQTLQHGVKVAPEFVRVNKWKFTKDKVICPEIRTATWNGRMIVRGIYGPNEGRWDADVSVTPATIDFIRKDGARIRGIFRIQKRELQIAFADTVDAPRPKAFECSEGSHLYIFTRLKSRSAEVQAEDLAAAFSRLASNYDELLVTEQNQKKKCKGVHGLDDLRQEALNAVAYGIERNIVKTEEWTRRTRSAYEQVKGLHRKKKYGESTRVGEPLYTECRNQFGELVLSVQVHERLLEPYTDEKRRRIQLLDKNPATLRSQSACGLKN